MGGGDPAREWAAVTGIEVLLVGGTFECVEIPFDTGLEEIEGGGNLSNEEEEAREDAGESAEGEENPFAPLPSALSIIAIVFFFFFLIGVSMGII